VPHVRESKSENYKAQRGRACVTNLLTHVFNFAQEIVTGLVGSNAGVLRADPAVPRIGHGGRGHR